MNAVSRVLAILVLGCLFIRTTTAREPQPPLPEVSLRVGSTSLQVEVADEDHERVAGLMYRTDLDEGRGMLFVFPAPQPMGFWMRNTTIPLSIAYINAAGVIREIHDLQPLHEVPTESTFRDLVYALEVPQGWFSRHKVLPGDKILGLPAASLAR
jgi:uncharacterized membrane protein (UPF0127 family)